MEVVRSPQWSAQPIVIQIAGKRVSGDAFGYVASVGVGRDFVMLTQAQFNVDSVMKEFTLTGIFIQLADPMDKLLEMHPQ
jgi:hypothetical protein